MLSLPAILQKLRPEKPQLRIVPYRKLTGHGMDTIPKADLQHLKRNVEALREARVKCVELESIVVVAIGELKIAPKPLFRQSLYDPRELVTNAHERTPIEWKEVEKKPACCMLKK
jgi:hypothetical protein